MFSCVSLNSKDSLEEFLSLYQCKDQKKRTMLKKEREIVRYLKSLGLQMKTDPLNKLRHATNFHVIHQNSSDEEVVIHTVQPHKEEEFDLSNNPIIKRASKKMIRTFSFEKNNENLTNIEFDVQINSSSNIQS